MVSGCAGEPTREDPRIGDASACPVKYPDGSPFDCANATLRTAPGIVPTRPAPGSGWICKSRSNDDTGAGAMTRFSHQDGRMGVWWDWLRAPKFGVGLVNVELFTKGGNQAFITPYQAKGFYAFPKAPAASTGDVWMLVREFRLDVKEGGEWAPAKNATLLVGEYQGHSWFVWRFETANGTRFLDLMVHRPGTELRQYQAEKRFHEEDGLELFADAVGIGFKALGTDFAPAPHTTAACEVNEAV